MALIDRGERRSVPTRRARAQAALASAAEVERRSRHLERQLVPNLGESCALIGPWPPTPRNIVALLERTLTDPDPTSRSPGSPSCATSSTNSSAHSRACAAGGRVVRRRSRGRSASRARPRTAATATSPRPPQADTLARGSRGADQGARGGRPQRLGAASTARTCCWRSPGPRVDVDAARRSFGPPRSMPPAPAGCTRRCTPGSPAARGKLAGSITSCAPRSRTRRAAAARPARGRAGAAAHSNSFLTVAMLRMPS